MRYLAVDFGDKRTGIALGDDETFLVTPLDVIECASGLCGGDALIDLVTKSIDDSVSPQARCELVVGLPMNMDGTEGPRAKAVRALAASLAARSRRHVHFQDERLTSAAADWSMAKSGLTHKQKKERRDALAAAAILTDFLNARKRSTTDDEPD